MEPIQVFFIIMTLFFAGGIMGIIVARQQQREKEEKQIPPGHGASKQYLRIVSHAEMSQIRQNFISIAVNNVGPEVLEPTHQVNVFTEGLDITEGPDWKTLRRITWEEIYAAAKPVV